MKFAKIVFWIAGHLGNDLSLRHSIFCSTSSARKIRRPSRIPASSTASWAVPWRGKLLFASWPLIPSAIGP